MLDDRTVATIRGRFLQHLKREQVFDALFALRHAPDRLLRWIAARPEERAWTNRIAEGAAWLALAFSRIEETGARAIDETERVAEIATLRERIERSDVDKAILGHARRSAGAVLNSGLVAPTNGHLMIVREGAKRDYPFDLIVLEDSSDGLAVTAVIIGQVSDSPERIQRELHERLGPDGLGAVRSKIAKDLFGPNILQIVARELRVEGLYIGGSSERGKLDGTRVWPLNEWLTRLDDPSTDFSDYLEHGAGPDHYETGTRVDGDETLNNARFSLDRRAISLEDWKWALQLMTPHHHLIRSNMEIICGIQLASPLEVGLKYGQ